MYLAWRQNKAVTFRLIWKKNEINIISGGKFIKEIKTFQELPHVDFE